MNVRQFNVKDRIISSNQLSNVGQMDPYATGGAVTGLVLVGIGISFLWGKHVGGWAVEKISGKKLTDSQKNALGVTSVLLI